MAYRPDTGSDMSHPLAVCNHQTMRFQFAFHGSYGEAKGKDVG